MAAWNEFFDTYLLNLLYFFFQIWLFVQVVVSHIGYKSGIHDDIQYLLKSYARHICGWMERWQLQIALYSSPETRAAAITVNILYDLGWLQCFSKLLTWNYRHCNCPWGTNKITKYNNQSSKIVIKWHLIFTYNSFVLFCHEWGVFSPKTAVRSLCMLLACYLYDADYLQMFVLHGCSVWVPPFHLSPQEGRDSSPESLAALP